MLRVLLVEDNLGDVTFFRAALAECGILLDLTVIRDGATAWQQISCMLNGSAAPVDLIILDLNLPGMSGWEILAGIAASPSGCRVPIAMFTSILIDPPIEEQYPLLRIRSDQKTSDFGALKEIVRNMVAFAEDAA